MANSFANYNATKDATLAYDAYGNGQCPDLFVGSEGDSIIDRRALVYCPVTKPSGFVSLVNAWFYIRCRTGSVTGHDTPTTSATDFALRKLTSSWSEGTAGSSTDHAYYSSNSVVWPGPNYSGSKTMTFNDGSWISVSITDWVQAFFNGTDTNYGFRLEATSGLPNLVFYSRESGSEPYIRIEYTTNTAPTAPTIVSPTGGSILASQTPDLKFKPQDPQGDNHSKYQYQVDDDSAFGSPIEDTQVTGTFTNNVEVTRTVVNTLTRGTTYYWRVKTWDAAGLEGAWSAAQQFKIGQVPTRTVQQPSGADTIIKTQFTAGSGQTGPRLVVEWTPTCADGGTQDYYRVEVYNDSTGSPGTTFESSGDVFSTATSWTSSNYPVNGNKYHVRVYTQCSHGIWSTDASYIRCRARWAYTIQKGSLTGVPTSWSATPTTTNGDGQIVLEYGSSSSSGDTTPASGWKANIGDVPLNQYFFYRAWGLIWGAGSGLTSPSLDKFVLSYFSNSLTPDKWTKKVGSATQETIDTGNFVYGTQSVKVVGNSTNSPGFKQVIPVLANTDYVISWRWMGSAVKASVEVWSEGRTTFIAWKERGSATWAWEHDSFSFNSGERTTVEVSINVDNTTSGTLWVDAMKCEASTVVTPWSPALLGAALVVDAGGIQIDASNYGLFRLRGSSGGTRDRVDLATKGLKFGGDIEIASANAREITLLGAAGSNPQSGSDYVQGAIRFTNGTYDMGKIASVQADGYYVDNADLVFYTGRAGSIETLRLIGAPSPVTKLTGLLRAGGSSFPSNKETGDRYFRTDIGLEFFWNGTRWLSTQLFTQAFGGSELTTEGASGNRRWFSQHKHGGSDLWIEDVHYVFRGGVTLDTSNYFTFSLDKVISGGSTITGVSSKVWNSGTSSYQYEHTDAVDALFGSTSIGWRVAIAVNGAPSNCYWAMSATYRVVAT